MKKDEKKVLDPFLLGAGAVLAGILLDRSLRAITVPNFRAVVSTLVDARFYWRSAGRAIIEASSNNEENGNEDEINEEVYRRFDDMTGGPTLPPPAAVMYKEGNGVQRGYDPHEAARLSNDQVMSDEDSLVYETLKTGQSPFPQIPAPANEWET